MSELAKEVTAGLQQVAEDAQASFGSLSAAQLNWKPEPESWSVAQCFDHLITTHSLYFPRFGRLARGNAEMSYWEEHSLFSGFFGRFLVKSLDPKNPKKIKTSAKAFPSTSEISSDIIERFCEHQQQMIDHIEKLPATIDPAKMIITSPLMGLITYSLENCLIFLPMHCRRHFNQAKRVTEMNGFSQ